MLGTRFIGRYKVIEELGRGGMGIVYRGEDPRLDRPVAIKVLPPRKTSGKALERFNREARVCARLDHPYILKIYDYGQEEETYHIVMEYVEGITLRDVIGEEPRVEDISVSEMARIFGQICQALEYAHSLGITHRDIKPENIMVTSTSGRWEPATSRVKVMDFGLAVLEGQHSLTDHGAVMGTIAYFSPEQAKGEPADHRSDIYSLGAVFYEMLTGALPFEATNPSEMIRRHLETPPPSPRVVNPRVPAVLERLVLRSMRKQPQERFQAVSEMRDELEAYRAEAQIPAHYFWGTGLALPDPVPQRRRTDPNHVMTAADNLPPLKFRRRWDDPPADDAASERPPAGAAVPPADEGERRRLQQLWQDGRPVAPVGDAPPPPQRRALDVSPLASPHTPGMPPDLLRRVGAPPVPSAPQRPDGELPQKAVDVETLQATSNLQGVGPLDAQTVHDADLPRPRTPLLSQAPDKSVTDAPPPAGPPVRGLAAAGGAPVASREWVEQARESNRVLGRYEDYMRRLNRDDIATRGRSGDVPPSVCATCGIENAGDRKYCVECGGLLEQSQFLIAREAAAHVELGLKHLRRQDFLEAQFEFQQALERDPNHAEAHKHLGRTWRGMGDLAKAEDELRIALSFSPQDADAMVCLAHVLRQTDRKSEAVAMLSEAIRLRPSDPDLRVQLAFLHAHRGNLVKAVEEYRTALAYDQENLEAHLQLGIIYGAQNFVKEAAAEFEWVTRLDPNNVTAWQWLGKLYTRLNRLADAEKAFQNAVGLAPNDPDVHADLGVLYEVQRREDQAVRELRQAIAIEQGHSDARTRLAQFYMRRNQPAMAIRELEELVSFHPTDTRVHQQLGELYLGQGELDRALQHFEKTVSLDPASADMHNRLGQLYLKKDYNSLSIAEYQKAVGLDPYNPTFHEDLGMAYYVSGNRDAAIQEIKKACILDAHNVDYFKALGMLSVEEGRLEEAIQHLKRALELSPRDGQAHGLLGRVYAQQKLLNWAVLEFQKAIDYEPDNQLMHIYLARAYAELGRPDQAVGEFRQAINLMNGPGDQPENRRALCRSYQDLGKAYLETGDLQAAREMIESALMLVPTEVRTMHLMGLVYAAQKNWPKALDFLSDALQREPQNPDILSDVGHVYQQTGQLDKALKALRNALKLSPSKPLLYERVATVLTEQGKHDEARQLIRKAMAMESRRVDYYHGLLGRLYALQEQWQKAAGEYQQAMTINAWDWTYHQGLARAFERLGRPAEAADVLRKALDKLQLSTRDRRQLQEDLDRVRTLR